MIDDKTYTTRLNTTGLSDIRLDKFVRIELFCSGTLTVIEKQELPFYVGRDEDSCDLIIQGDTISRRHCVFQLRDNQIGVMDTSTNGTHVKPGRTASVFIHNDYYPLVGQGSIKLGTPIESDDPEVLLFKVVTQ